MSDVRVLVVDDEPMVREVLARYLEAEGFAVEMAAGHLAGSQALQADALDFLGDTLTYGVSLAVIGMAAMAVIAVILLAILVKLF